MTTKQYINLGALLCAIVVIFLIALWAFTDTFSTGPSVSVPAE